MTADVDAAFDALFDALLVRRDAEAGTRLFCDEAGAVMWGSDLGERADGLGEIAGLHRDIAGFPGELRFDWQHRSAHVDGDVAWVNAAGEVRVAPTGEASSTAPYRLTAVFVRRAGQWRWHTFNGSSPG